MGAITDNYEPADAAVRFFAAGGDVLLMPEDFSATYTGVVKAGGLKLEQIDASVKRVLKVKESAGLLPKTVA
jgi:beta-N-acetylhexosaminidase